MIERHQLRKIFQESFQSFLTQEVDNILLGTSERNLCGRLATYLEISAKEFGIDRRYRADVEYNRMQNGRIKTMIGGDLRIIPITCDLILHSRGEVVEQDNLVAIEMKRCNHAEKDKAKDRERLRVLTKVSFDGVWSADGETLPEHVCGYVLGYFAELDEDARLFSLEEYTLGSFNRSWGCKF